MLYVLDKYDKVVTVLCAEQAMSAGIQVLHAKTKEVNGGASTLEVSIDSSHKDSGLISDTENQSILFRDNEGNWQQYFIVEIEDEHSTTQTKTLFGESISQEIENRFCTRDVLVDDLDGTPEALVGFCLSFSRWQLGECDIVDDKIHLLETKNKSVGELLDECASIYFADYQFRIAVDPSSPSKILGRYVDFKKSLAVDKGKIFSVGKDIVSIKRSIDSSGVKTAIIPVVTTSTSSTEEEGEEAPSISIKDIEWSIAKGDPTDKPKGQEWLGNDTTLQQWGYYNKTDQTMNHRFMKAEFGEASTPEQLIQQAWNVLNMNSTPRATYEVSVVDLYRLTKDDDLKHEMVRNGEKVRIVDKDFSPPLIVEAHIVEIERDLIDPSNDLVVIGNPRNTISDSFSQIQTQLQDKITIKDLSQTITQLKENTYYIENERIIEAGIDGKDLLYLNMVLTDHTEVMLHFSACLYVPEANVVTFELINNGSPFFFKPKQTMTVGYNIVSFNIPMFDLETLIENKLFLRLTTDVGTVVAEPKQANIVVKGSKVLISDKLPPFTRGEHYELIEYTPMSIHKLTTSAVAQSKVWTPMTLQATQQEVISHTNLPNYILTIGGTQDVSSTD